MNYDQSYRFPDGFAWGVATAAYQIEGAVHEDGRGESIWDTFSHTRGKIIGNDNGDVACDHYHRYVEDIALIRSLGVRHYRFSTAWPRVIPSGDGAINAAGLDFYDRLVDAQLAAGITPWLTLFHWDLPQALEDKGGWRSRHTVAAFDKYARAVVSRLGDRVKHWFTLNEIPCFTEIGYGRGDHAPGAREPRGVLNQIVHNALLAHGTAVQAIRELGGADARVGLAANIWPGVPVTETERNVAAARRYFEASNAQFVAPFYLKGYPEKWLASQGADAPQVDAVDGELIGSPMDFLGLNSYSGLFVEATDTEPGYRLLDLPEEYPRADVGWLALIPQALYWTARFTHEVYGEKRLYVTENGSCWADRPDADGRVMDLDRREYLRNYLMQVQRATAEGLPIRGYFLWSLLDNFEWGEGYAKRFGLVRVDYKTQKRTPKLSADWYAAVVKENRVL